MSRLEYIRGRMGYFGICESYHPIPEIDRWLTPVLPETAATRSPPISQASSTGRIAYSGTHGGVQSKGSPETVPDIGNPSRDDRSMAQGSRVSGCQRTVGQHSLPGYGKVRFVNRPVRTRTQSGVGAGGEKSSGYPIRFSSRSDGLRYTCGVYLK